MTRYLSAEKRTTDDFGQPFSMQEGESVYDATTSQGPWACMSEVSWKVFGTGVLGLGKGQRYERVGAHLIKVEG